MTLFELSVLVHECQFLPSTSAFSTWIKVIMLQISMCFQIFFASIGNLATISIKFDWCFWDTPMQQSLIYGDGRRLMFPFCCYFISIVRFHVDKLEWALACTEYRGIFTCFTFWAKFMPFFLGSFFHIGGKFRHIYNCLFQQSMRHAKILSAVSKEWPKIKISSEYTIFLPDNGSTSKGLSCTSIKINNVYGKETFYFAARSTCHQMHHASKVNFLTWTFFYIAFVVEGKEVKGCACSMSQK